MEPMNENTVFAELWCIVRDYYAPYMTASEATKKAMKAMADNGHEVTDLGPKMFMVDDEIFEIVKHRKTKWAGPWTHFNIRHHGYRWEQNS